MPLQSVFVCLPRYTNNGGSSLEVPLRIMKVSGAFGPTQGTVSRASVSLQLVGGVELVPCENYRGLVRD